MTSKKGNQGAADRIKAILIAIWTAIVTWAGNARTRMAKGMKNAGPWLRAWPGNARDRLVDLGHGFAEPFQGLEVRARLANAGQFLRAWPGNAKDRLVDLGHGIAEPFRAARASKGTSKSKKAKDKAPAGERIREWPSAAKVRLVEVGHSFAEPFHGLGDRFPNAKERLGNVGQAIARPFQGLREGPDGPD